MCLQILQTHMLATELRLQIVQTQLLLIAFALANLRTEVIWIAFALAYHQTASQGISEPGVPRMSRAKMGLSTSRTASWNPEL